MVVCPNGKEADLKSVGRKPVTTFFYSALTFAITFAPFKDNATYINGCVV